LLARSTGRTSKEIAASPTDHAASHNALNGAHRLNDWNGLLLHMPDVTGQKAVGARHRCLLEQAFQPQKAAAKPLNDAYFANLYQGIKIVR
jgi:hypothetical protein